MHSSTAGCRGLARSAVVLIASDGWSVAMPLARGTAAMLRLLAHTGDVNQPASAEAGVRSVSDRCSGLSARLDRMVAGVHWSGSPSFRR
jgi:hypothetical protein